MTDYDSDSVLSSCRCAALQSFLDVVVELEKLNKVSSEKLELIEQCLRNIRRADLAKKVQRYQMKGEECGSGLKVS